jgi:O-antigen/teichoic acid export membrane protein
VAILGIRPAALEFGGRLPGGEGARAAVFLCLYGVLALLNGVALAALRAADRFASTAFTFANLALMEAVAGLAVALRGGNLAAVALAYLLVRLAGTLACSALLRCWAPWVSGSKWGAEASEVRRLLRPGLAALLYPAGNAVALQGAVMAIGAVGGPAAVPAFAVVRTLARAALQFSFRFTVAAMPRYTSHVARGGEARASQVAVLNLAVALVLTLPAAALLLVFGREFVALWTNGRIVPSFVLVALMAVSMVLNALWSALSNLLLSVNRHETFAKVYLASSIAAVALGAVLAVRWRAEGMAWAMLLLDGAIAVCVWREARRNGITGGGRLLAATAGLAAEIAVWRKSPAEGIR